MTRVLAGPLTISDLARLTGVPSATLRSWESRHGFPRPTRLAGGHRRYARSGDAPDLPACLTAVEVPGRRFEALWSVDPQVVRDASLVSAALAGYHRPDWRDAGGIDLDEEVGDVSQELRRVSELFNRMLGCLEHTR